jgi:ADP-heptose:LPS heptosyltransferase
VQQTIERTGLRIPAIPIPPSFPSTVLRAAGELLDAHGRDASKRLIVINPAGLWPSRNWPVDNYVLLCKLWQDREPVQFLVLGTQRVIPTAELLSHTIGKSVINLAGRTTLAEALPLLRLADGMVTEDSGLMHMAWAVGVPLVALFGSSRHDWSAPPGEHVVCLHSGDLDCGACMQPTCAYGDTHCLTRYTPGFVLEQAFTLLHRRTSINRV